MPTTSAANSAADGTPTMVSGTVTATVAATSSTHLAACIQSHCPVTITSMPLTISGMQHGCICDDSEELPRYNLVMTDLRAESPATELRESMMAVTRQMRRHRPDHGLTLSQMEVLGEVSRTGVSTPAELGRPAARPGAVAHRQHQRTGEPGSGVAAPDDDDRRRQLIEITAGGNRAARRRPRRTRRLAARPPCATICPTWSSTC